MRREIYPHPELVTFYYLARYAGQRRSDLVNMRRDHIDTTRDEMFVAQIKTGARIWVPMPKPLRDYLETRPRRGDYIVMSTKTPGAPWRETSLTDEFIQVTRELGFQTTDSTGSRAISPHGLRHLCGVELAHTPARPIASMLITADRGSTAANLAPYFPAARILHRYQHVRISGC